MPTQTGSIDFTSAGGLKSYAAGQFATQGAVTDMQTQIGQNAEAITLRATKTEVQQVRPAYASSSTAAGTAAKVATIDPAVTGYALYKGASVAVTFSTANTAATPTLNLNSTGAKQIRSYTGAALSEAEYKWAAGSTIDLVYDGTYWRMQDSGAVKRVTAAEASISVNADNIESKVSKDGVISSINQSAETVKIEASRVEIDGTAVFSAISSNVDDAITGKGYQTSSQVESAITSKGYATTTQAQGYASTAKSEAISAAATDATTKANAAEANAKAYTDALEIGGRNLLLDTSTGEGWSYSTFDASTGEFTSATTAITESYVAAPLKAYVEQGQQYTLSVYAKSNGYVKDMDLFKYNANTAHIQYKLAISLTTEYKLYTMTFTANATEQVTIRFDNNGSTTSGTNAILYIKHPKLEKGNKATDWTPAPEDIEASAVKRTQRIWYRKSASGAPSTPGTASSNWVTKADDGNDAWTKMHIAINSTHKYIYTCEQYEMANGTVGYTSVLLDNTITVIDGGNIITGSVTANKLDAASINASKSLTVGAMTDAAASTILNSNVSVGGRNLSVEADYSEGFLQSSATALGPMDATRQEHTSDFIPVKTGDKYVFQTWVTPTTGSTEYLWMAYQLYDSSKALLGSRPSKYAGANTGLPQHEMYEITIPSGAAYIRISARLYSDGKMKLERGNKATDWTSAPEDVESSIIEASKTASNYITADSTGIKIHMSGSTSTYQHQSSTATTYYVNGNKRAEVGASGLKVYVGTTGSESSVAEFGTTARVGSASGPNVYVESGGVTVRDGTTGVVKFSGEAATGSYTRSSSVELAGWNGTALRMRGDTSTDNRYIGLESGFGSLLSVRHTDSVTEYGSFEGNDFVELEADGLSVNGTTVDMDKQVLPAFLEQSGMVGQSISASANAVTTHTVTFPIPYAASPIVTACFYSTSAAAAFGGLSLSVSAITTTSFTVKIFNNTSTGRTVGIFWIAAPQTTLT